MASDGLSLDTWLANNRQVEDRDRHDGKSMETMELSGGEGHGGVKSATSLRAGMRAYAPSSGRYFS
jgi:hypothetical protein